MGGVHPQARVGGRPEHREWMMDDSRPDFAPAVDASATVCAFVTVDAGCVRPTRIGARSVLLQHVHIGHDAIVGDDCEVATGTVIGGHAEIGDGAKVGINATILPYRKVGKGARVGAGSVVTRDVPAGATVVGNPARVLEDHERDPRPHTERVERECGLMPSEQGDVCEVGGDRPCNPDGVFVMGGGR